MTIAIHPHEIASLLDRFPQATCLSLDCFDTLLWRDCRSPADLFATLPGVTKGQRADAERRARKAQDLAGRGTEVSAGHIYARLMPNASDAEREAAIAEELKAEARHCYAFAPTVELMRTAKARGMTRDEVVKNVLLAAQPTKQFVQPEEIGSLAVFLCSPAAHNLTGVTIPVDGGWTAQ